MNVMGKKGAITTPRGFKASGISSGIKSRNRLDCALLFSEYKARAAAVFTTNKVKSWPVVIGKGLLPYGFHRAVIINSGNANCCNGIQNKKKVGIYCRALAHALGIKKHEVLPSSTGIIGRDFPLKNVLNNMPQLVKRLSRNGGHAAAQAILTTDTRTKEAHVSFSIKGKRITIAAMAKGSGMIHPHMATMLVFITTDINISKRLLQAALKTVNERTFNMISVDNDRSTNDTVLILANGAAGNAQISTKGKEYNRFVTALEMLSQYIARGLVRDGEGVTKICEISISSACNESQAKQAACAIADSMLFKTALHGGDPNWGRIVAALGAQQGIDCHANKMTISFGNYIVFKKGEPYNRNLGKAHQAFRKRNVHVTVDLGRGKACARFLTSDLSRKYITINAEYTT